MADYLDIYSGTDHNGYHASVHRPTTGQSAPVIVPLPLTTSTTLGIHAKNFATVFEATTGKLIDGTNRYSEQGFRDLMKPDVFQQTGEVFRIYRTAAIEQRNDLHSMKADWATPKFTKDDDRAPFRAELRSKMGAMKPMQAIEAALRNSDMAVAMAEGGEAMALAMGWTADIYARFLDGFAERNLANRLIGQHGITLKPTANDILRDGPDNDAAIRAAREHIANLNSSFDEIDAVEALLGSVVDFAAVTMDTDRGAAFDMLMAA